jgi:hypothetical protein
MSVFYNLIYNLIDLIKISLIIFKKLKVNLIFEDLGINY